MLQEPEKEIQEEMTEDVREDENRKDMTKIIETQQQVKIGPRNFNDMLMSEIETVLEEQQQKDDMQEEALKEEIEKVRYQNELILVCLEQAEVEGVEYEKRIKMLEKVLKEKEEIVIEKEVEVNDQVK